MNINLKNILAIVAAGTLMVASISGMAGPKKYRVGLKAAANLAASGVVSGLELDPKVAYKFQGMFEASIGGCMHALVKAGYTKDKWEVKNASAKRKSHIDTIDVAAGLNCGIVVNNKVKLDPYFLLNARFVEYNDFGVPGGLTEAKVKSTRLGPSVGILGSYRVGQGVDLTMDAEIINLLSSSKVSGWKDHSTDFGSRMEAGIRYTTGDTELSLFAGLTDINNTSAAAVALDNIANTPYSFEAQSENSFYGGLDVRYNFS